jgi:hypothetical protein
MQRNAVGAGGEGGFCRLDRVRVVATAGVTQRGDVVDIDAEAWGGASQGGGIIP